MAALWTRGTLSLYCGSCGRLTRFLSGHVSHPGHHENCITREDQKPLNYLRFMPAVMMYKQCFFGPVTTFKSNNHSRYSTFNPDLGLKSKENYNVIR